MSVFLYLWLSWQSPILEDIERSGRPDLNISEMTAQTPENLIYKDRLLPLCSEPLKHFPGVSPLEWPYFARSSSALSRGYHGTWEIASDRLYLRALSRLKRYQGAKIDVGIEDLFPGHPDGVFAHWYAGDLRCPRGALLNYVHGGFASTYEEDLFLTVQHGVVIGERVIRNGTAPPDAKAGYVIKGHTFFGR